MKMKGSEEWSGRRDAGLAFSFTSDDWIVSAGELLFVRVYFSSVLTGTREDNHPTIFEEEHSTPPGWRPKLVLRSCVMRK